MKTHLSKTLILLFIFINELNAGPLITHSCIEPVTQDSKKNEMKKNRIKITESNNSGHGLNLGELYKFKIPNLHIKKRIYNGYVFKNPNFLVKSPSRSTLKPNKVCDINGLCNIDIINVKPTVEFESFNQHSDNIEHIMKMWVIEFNENGMTKDGDDLFIITIDDKENKFNSGDRTHLHEKEDDICGQHLGIIHAGESGG